MPSKMRTSTRRGTSGISVENGTDEATVMLYGDIGAFGLPAKDVLAELDAISARTIHLHVNSRGGDVFDGLAIANAIRAHSARVITHVDALAASIASVIALAGDYVRIADNAFLMIHNPYTIGMGDATELRKTADLLDKIGGSIVSEYAKRSGQTADQVKQWMDAETWFSAAEAKARGFVDAIDNESDAPTDAFDLSIFDHAPAALSRESSGEPTIRELEQAVRDAGLSRSQARQLVAAGLRSVQHDSRDASPPPDPVLRDGLQQLLATLQ